MNDLSTIEERIGLNQRWIVYIIIIFLIWCLIKRFVIAMMCKNLSEEKGYGNMFVTGFILGRLGLHYVVSLPDKELKKYVKRASMKMQILDEKTDGFEEMN